MKVGVTLKMYDYVTYQPPDYGSVMCHLKPRFRIVCLTALPQPLLEIPAMDDAMDKDDTIRIKDLVDDAVVADPQTKEFVVWSLDRLDEFARRSWIHAQGVDGSFKSPPLRL